MQMPTIRLEQCRCLTDWDQFKRLTIHRKQCKCQAMHLEQTINIPNFTLRSIQMLKFTQDQCKCQTVIWDQFQCLTLHWDQCNSQTYTWSNINA